MLNKLKNVLSSLELSNEKSIKRVTYQLQVRPETRAAIELIRARTGAPATHVAARLLDWFAAQPPPVQAAILDPDGDVIGLLMRELGPKRK